jgi:hypothetical protein
VLYIFHIAELRIARHSGLASAKIAMHPANCAGVPAAVPVWFEILKRSFENLYRQGAYRLPNEAHHKEHRR